VASELAKTFFVVCPDLRGYGQSTLPPDAPGHVQSSKRAIVGDVAALMRHLGRDRFSVAGHDRGALVAFRAAMDYPAAVERLVVMDGLPVTEHLERLNEAFVRTWWHWWFLGQTDKPAEAFISADPGRWYQTPPPGQMGEDNHADAWAAFRDPAVVHGAPRKSGGPGWPASYAAASSTPGTTKPKKRQKRSPRHFCSSSGRSISARQPLTSASHQAVRHTNL
jgi:haloacetate dehalogenase